MREKRREARTRGRRPPRPRVALAPMLACRGTDDDLTRLDDAFLLSVVPDGWRCLVVLDDRVRLRSRSGRDLAPELPALAGALAALRPKGGATTILDALLVLPAARDGALPTLHDVAALEVLDVLCVRDRDVTSAPLLERQAHLRAERWPGSSEVRLAAAWRGDARATLAQLDSGGGGGALLARRAASPYRPGHRSDDWLLFGARETEEVLLCGIAASGALVLGAPTPHGLVYAGLAWPTRAAQLIAARCREGRPAVVADEMWPSLGPVTWVEPDLWLAVEPDVRAGSGRGGPRRRLVRVQEDLSRPPDEVARRAAATPRAEPPS